MNKGQEQFYNFIINRIQESYFSEIKELLENNFIKQSNGTFTKQDLLMTQEIIMKALKSEYIEEVKKAMAHFAVVTK